MRSCAGLCIELLDGGALPTSHIRAPHSPDPVVADQHCPARLQHVVHHALHGGVPGGGEGEGGGVLSLEDVLHSGLDVIHDLAKFWVQVTYRGQRLGLEDSLTAIGGSRTSHSLQRDGEWLGKRGRGSHIKSHGAKLLEWKSCGLGPQQVPESPPRPHAAGVKKTSCWIVQNG